MNFQFSPFGRRSGSRPSARLARCESLESRIALSATAVTSETLEDLVTPLAMDHDPHDEHMMYPGGVMVTPTEIHTHTDIIPRFAASPTISSMRSGNWDDPATWSEGRVPRSGDRISIQENHTVLLSSQVTARLDALEISGTLSFSTTRDTRLLVANILVMPMGHLRIGTASAPVAANVTAEVVIADKPLNLAADPRQFGTGLIALGEVTIHGAAIPLTWQRLASEPKAGDRILYLSQPVTNWQPGDTIVLPDSRQVSASQIKDFAAGNVAPEWEEAVIQYVYGNAVVLTQPIKFDHVGGRNVDGVLEFLPHIAVLDRNVLIRSENPAGTRGHTLFTARADVSISYAEFQDLGRTDAMRPLDNSTFDAMGNVTHVGTNQIGRYAIHLHHVIGPENPTNTGFQFELVGNSIHGSKKWGMALHGASFGLVDRNVVYDAQGSGIVTEDGTEIGNIIKNNIVMRVQGTGIDGSDGTLENDFGRGGVGFWFRRGGNQITGNVAADNTFAGFVISGYNLKPGMLPLFRGADLHDPMQTVDGTNTPTTLMRDNEAYGMTPTGLWAAFINGNNLTPNQAPTLVVNLRLWNIHQFGVTAYHTAGLTFSGLTILGSMSARDRNDTGAMGMDLRIYENLETLITGSRIEGMYVGVFMPSNDSSQFGMGKPTIISNSVLRNYINIQVIPPKEGLPTATNSIEIRNVKFDLVSRVPNWPAPSAVVRPSTNILMTLDGARFIDYTRSSTVRVYDYNQLAGDNFQVYYKEQSADYILPATMVSAIGTRDQVALGSPRVGLTNAQNWSLYGLSMGGAVLPASARTRGGITGFVAPISTEPVPASVVFVTPWDNSYTTTDYLRVRFNINGTIPAGARVYIQLDDNPPTADLPKGGLYNIPLGTHLIRAYLGDASGLQIAGTRSAISRFTRIA